MNGGMFGGNNNNTGSVVVLENGIQFPDLTLQNTAYVVSNSAIRNRIINGAMKVDQRNAGVAQAIVAAAALAYTVDRHYGFCTGANVTGQRIALANAQNRYRFTGLAAVTGVGFGQRIEAVNCLDMAGANATLQAKLSSSSLSATTWTAYYATTTDTFGTLAAPTRTQFATGQFIINSVEATYNAQMVVPVAAITGIEIVFTAGALLATQTLTIGDVQFEAGNIPTPFENNNLTIITAKCQRFLPSFNGGANNIVGSGASFDASNHRLTVLFKSEARIAPTGIFVSAAGDFLVRSGSSADIPLTGINFSSAGISGASLTATSAASSAANIALIFASANSSAKLYFTGVEL